MFILLLEQYFSLSLMLLTSVCSSSLLRQRTPLLPAQDSLLASCSTVLPYRNVACHFYVQTQLKTATSHSLSNT
jgi:hypothetical protein